MATNYPGALDSLTNPGAGDALNSPSHSAQHANANDAIEAVETELGVNPSGSDATVAARLSAIEAGTNLATGAVTSAKIANGTIVSSDVAADTFAAFGTVGNLLTANQASVETDTTGWEAHGGCTIARSTAQASTGAASLAATAAGGDFQVKTPDGLAGIPVVAGQTYTFTADVKTNGTADSSLFRIYWNDASGAYVAIQDTPLLTPTSSAWTTFTATTVAPATAAYATVYFFAYSAPAGRVYYIDKVGVWKGAGGQWQLPGVPIPGQSRIAVNGAVDLSGTGVPNGNVTAAPGSSFLQVGDAVTVSGNLLWRKATGTGNTGWVPEGALADTGWRKVTLTNSWADGTDGFYIRRIGSVVYVHSRGISGASATAYEMYTLPTGFVAAKALTVPVAKAGTTFDGSATVAFAAISSGTAGGVASYTAAAFEAVFPTANAWPTSLPGVAA